MGDDDILLDDIVLDNLVLDNLALDNLLGLDNRFHDTQNFKVKRANAE
ncbi:MAG: hypothetical protein AAFZ80_13450 [Cyanobacteria bacterium P01_A01_bin.105]